MPGLKESNARLGTEVDLKTTGEAVTAPAGGGKQFFPKTGGELALETPMPGIYSVVTGAVTNQFSVNVLAADKSDFVSVRHRTLGQMERGHRAAAGRNFRRMDFWVARAGIALRAFVSGGNGERRKLKCSSFSNPSGCCCWFRWPRRGLPGRCRIAD